jgi:hypothetical protein
MYGIPCFYNVGKIGINPALVTIPVPPPANPSFLLLENGDSILLENGSELLLESAT